MTSTRARAGTDERRRDTVAAAAATLEGLDDAALLEHAGAVLEHLAARRLASAEESAGDGLATGDGTLGEAHLLASVEAIERLTWRLVAERLWRIAELDERQTCLRYGASSTAGLLAAHAGVSFGQAKREVADSVALDSLPATAARLAAGRLDPRHARSATDSLTRLKDDRELSKDPVALAAAKADVDALVAAEGPESSVARLRRRLADLEAERGAPSLEERERRAHRHRWVRLSPPSGKLRLRRLSGELDPEAGALLASFLDAHGAAHGPHDERDEGQRHADALADAIRRILDDGGLSPAERRGPDGDPAAAGAGRCPGDPAAGDPAAAGAAGCAGDPAAGDPPVGAAAPPDAAAPPGDPPVGPAALPDAAAPPGDPPTPRGPMGRPHLLMLTSAEALAGDPDAAPSELVGHGPVSSATAQRLACDAEMRTIAWHGNDTIDVGRRHRNPTRSLRAAVIVRDRRCIGCEAPATRCQVHHINWWRDGGPTDLANLTLVCSACHHRIHHEGWTVVADGQRFRLARPAAGAGRAARSHAPQPGDGPPT